MTNIKQLISKRLLSTTFAVTALILPTLAFAQYAPPYDDAGASTQIQGTIDAINGPWNITVHDVNGYADSVALHQGTIINPTGLTLEPGMSVTIDGYADGPNFDAIEIDTPYQYEGPPPVAVYYGPGAWYPGYAYGWGPSFSLAFDFGTRSFQRRPFYFGGQFRRPVAPPEGWQNRPHGYIAGSDRSWSRSAYAAPQQQYRRYSVPQQQFRSYAAPQQQYHSYAASQRQYRSYAAPQQQYRGYTAARGRSYAAPQGRSYSAPQARSYSARQGRSYAAPASRDGRNSDSQRHR